MQKATCNMCDGGTMIPKKVYRMSTPVVAIGYIFLVPSIIMILCFGGCALLAGGSGASVASSDMTAEVASSKLIALETLGKGGFVEAEAESILAEGNSMTLALDEKYTSEQKEVIRKAHSEYMDEDEASLIQGAAAVAGGFGAIIGIIGMVISFVGGLIGWVLIMKKSILKCNSCSASVDAA